MPVPLLLLALAAAAAPPSDTLLGVLTRTREAAGEPLLVAVAGPDAEAFARDLDAALDDATARVTVIGGPDPLALLDARRAVEGVRCAVLVRLERSQVTLVKLGGCGDAPPPPAVEASPPPAIAEVPPSLPPVAPPASEAEPPGPHRDIVVTLLHLRGSGRGLVPSTGPSVELRGGRNRGYTGSLWVGVSRYLEVEVDGGIRWYPGRFERGFFIGPQVGAGLLIYGDGVSGVLSGALPLGWRLPLTRKPRRHAWVADVAFGPFLQVDAASGVDTGIVPGSFLEVGWGFMP